ncbi:RNA polymerase sigma factor SigJ [Nocardia puris]|uniref:RNA polymerase sigma-70 factor (ECF subfamily) n=1 Tax=Nocardia puris TaxID=208602 RepID=A0A366DBY2_9NOCA|nr:RNA polymerase sigma factor SigJ [Nocardia puris]RBO86934.1 RNA polymerase sigma-70 factor (ECF subfamily) [Nocardia puris]
MVAALLADLFESHRAPLLSVAYRLTGGVVDAEDAVGETWLRLTGTHQSEIDELRPWLIAMVGRICLDHMRGAPARRETYVGQWLPEPVVTKPAASGVSDPLETVVRQPECRMAMMVALDALTPERRLALVLHEAGLSFEEIADILEVPVAQARSAAEQGRETVRDVPAPVSDTEHDAAVRKLLAALESGDEAAVVAALHPDAVLMGDANGTTPTVTVVGGAERIAREMLALVRRYGIGASCDAATRYELATVNGRTGVVMNLDSATDEQDWHPARVVGFTVRDGVIWGAYDHANPAKLTGVRLG